MFPVLTTERLILRVPQQADLDRWAEMMSVESSAKHIGGVQPRAVVWRALACMVGAWSLTGVSMYSVLDKNTGLWLGRCGPWQPEGWPGTEIGWGLHPDAEGRGIAFEAVTACIADARARLGWTSIVHHIAPDNLRSQNLAKRLGAVLVGPAKLPAPYQDEAIDVWGYRS